MALSNRRGDVGAGVRSLGGPLCLAGEGSGRSAGGNNSEMSCGMEDSDSAISDDLGGRAAPCSLRSAAGDILR